MTSCCQSNVEISYIIESVEIENNKLKIGVDYELISRIKGYWLYDQTSGSDIQYIKNYVENNSIKISFYIVKPKNENEWLPSFGYNANYPKFIELPKNVPVKGKWILYYPMTEEVENYIFDYIITNQECQNIEMSIPKLRDFQEKKCKRFEIVISSKDIEDILYGKDKD